MTSQKQYLFRSWTVRILLCKRAAEQDIKWEISKKTQNSNEGKMKKWRKDTGLSYATRVSEILGIIFSTHCITAHFKPNNTVRLKQKLCGVKKCHTVRSSQTSALENLNSSFHPSNTYTTALILKNLTNTLKTKDVSMFSCYINQNFEQK